MAEYELILEVDELTEAHEDLLSDELGVVVSMHGGTTLVSSSFSARSALDAARRATTELASRGITVRRLYEDLVTRGDIAARAGVTKQAVGLWIRGDRQTERPFPVPYNLAAGGVWLWSEVNSWLHGIGKADGLEHPDRREYALFNAECARSTVGWRVTSRFSEPVRYSPQQFRAMASPSVAGGSVRAPLRLAG
jgi:hypothetical protein